MAILVGAADLAHESAVKPLLIFSFGNPSRGDDAVGPMFTDLFEKHISHTPLAEKLECLTDFQLQIEHAVDLKDRQKVVFVDASLNCQSPFEFKPITAQQDTSFTTHALHPSALLYVYEQVYAQQPPPCYLLSIRSFEFELGQEITKKAQQTMYHSLMFIDSWANRLLIKMK